MLMFHQVIAQQAAQSAMRSPTWPFGASPAAFSAQQGEHKLLLCADLLSSIFLPSTNQLY